MADSEESAVPFFLHSYRSEHLSTVKDASRSRLVSKRASEEGLNKSARRTESLQGDQIRPSRTNLI